MSIKVINLPDIGSDSAEVIEVLVSVGDTLDADTSIVVVETDKASVEVPAGVDGVLEKLLVSVGDKVAEGDAFMEVSQAEAAASAPADEAVAAEQPSETVEAPAAAAVVTESASTLYTVPDLGADSAEIIEIVVAVGDSIDEGDSIVVVETDKASVEIPAEVAGTVEALHVNVGDKISQGQDLVTLVSEQAVAASEPTAVAETSAAPASDTEVAQAAATVTSEPTVELFTVPDLGADSAEIIELSVAVGDKVEEGDSIIAVETDKASVEVPAEKAGTIQALHVAEGDKIGQGADLVSILVEGTAAPAAAPVAPAAAPAATAALEPAKEQPKKPAPAPAPAAAKPSGNVHAGPAARKLARELGVNLALVKASGPRGRIVKDDIKAYVKQRLEAPAGVEGGSGIPAIPAVDWSKFGDVRIEPVSRIGKITADNMVRNWLNVPHVTQFDDADVQDIEDYRQMLKAEAKARGVKMTPVAFLLKAAAWALMNNPKFNSAVSPNGEELIYREYCHISIAVDTPAGLMVPVIRDCDKKDIWQLADDIITMANKAKSGKLSPKEMQGACFTISSLGAIGGTGFTPIVPAPQVGILGVSKTAIKPVWNGSEFIPRKLMPLALSYDHRVINGSDAGKFMTELVHILGSVDRIWHGLEA